MLGAVDRFGVLVQPVVVVVHVTVALVRVVLEQLRRVRRNYWLEQLARSNCVRILAEEGRSHLIAVVRTDSIVQECLTLLGGTPRLSCARVGEPGVRLDHVAWRVVRFSVLVSVRGYVLPLAPIHNLLRQPVLLEQFGDLDLVVESPHVALGVSTRQKFKAAKG